MGRAGKSIPQNFARRWIGRSDGIQTRNRHDGNAPVSQKRGYPPSRHRTYAVLQDGCVVERFKKGVVGLLDRGGEFRLRLAGV